MAGFGCGSGPIGGGRANMDANGLPIPPMQPDLGVPAPDALVPPQPLDVVLDKEVDLPGSLQGLVAGQNGCRALRTVTPNGQIRYQFVNVGTDGQLSSSVELPNPDKRSYNILRPLKNGVAVSYESTQGYLRQDGTHHGVYLVFNDETTKDISVSLQGATRPTDVLQRGDNLYVLVNNGSIIVNKNKISYPKLSSVLVYDLNDLDKKPEKYELPLTNAGSMVLSQINGKEKLVVNGAGAYLDNQSAMGGIVVMNPDTFEVNSSQADNIAGLGLGAVALTGGAVVMTGSTPVRSLRLLTNQGLGSLGLPNDIQPQAGYLAGQQIYVPGAAAVSANQVLITVHQDERAGGITRTYLLSLEQNIPVKRLPREVPSTFAVPPASFSPNEFCSGATDSGVDLSGNTNSKVLFWRAP